MTTRWRGMVLVAVAVCGLACGSGAGGRPASDGGPDGAVGDAGTGADGSGDGLSLPDTPAGRALDWVLQALNGATPTEAEVNMRFSLSFLTLVPAPDVVTIFTQLAGIGPWTFSTLEGTVTPSMLVAVVRTGDGSYVRVAIATDGQTHIIGLNVIPAGDLDPALASWPAVDQALSALAPSASLMGATIDATACTPIHVLSPYSNLALGSAFKLWVLAALAADVAAGRHGWTDTIPIQDAHKSLPSGMLQDRTAGTLLSLRTFAEQMISISDNTAADHLLFFLGRDTVETMLGTTGHHDPASTLPFLATREMFTLKLMVTPAEQQAYIAGDVATRRTLLDQFDAAHDPRAYVGPIWVDPMAIGQLEWFATVGDLCNVMRALRDDGLQAATQPVSSILSINPGLPDVTARFAYVGFKGGSEPGVLNLTWLLRRQTDQQWVFLALTLNDPEHPIDGDRAAYVAGAARNLMASP